MSITNEDSIIIYTDGACSNNGNSKAVAGIGVYFGDNDERNISEKLEGLTQTNNRAEMVAVIRALQQVKEYNSCLYQVEIYTDSGLVFRGMTEWIEGWISRGWKKSNGKLLINLDLWKELHELSQEFENLRWFKVKAHSGIYGNEMADQLAVAGASL